MHVTRHLAKFKPRLKNSKNLSMHNGDQTADVTIISYKPLGMQDSIGVTFPIPLWGL